MKKKKSQQLPLSSPEFSDEIKWNSSFLSFTVLLKPTQRDLLQKKSWSLWGFSFLEKMKKMQPHTLESCICGTWSLGSQWLGRDRQQRDVAEERKWKMDRKDEWGWGVSSTIAASCPEKSIHHFHVFVSWLTLPIARSVAMMTQRIDEVQAGVASRGLEWRWSNQMWCEVGLGWTTRETWWRSWC